MSFSNQMTYLMEVRPDFSVECGIFCSDLISFWL